MKLFFIVRHIYFYSSNAIISLQQHKPPAKILHTELIYLIQVIYIRRKKEPIKYKPGGSIKKLTLCFSVLIYLLIFVLFLFAFAKLFDLEFGNYSYFFFYYYFIQQNKIKQNTVLFGSSYY